MKISQTGLDLIKDFEGYSATPYQDIAGKWTCGYGHLIKPGEDFSAGITEAQAQDLLQADVETAEKSVNAHIPEDCTQNQFDACVDFCYNMDGGNLQVMLAHGWNDVPNQILKWTYAGGVSVPGLVRRRAAEVALFTS